MDACRRKGRVLIFFAKSSFGSSCHRLSSSGCRASDLAVPRGLCSSIMLGVWVGGGRVENSRQQQQLRRAGGVGGGYALLPGVSTPAACWMDHD